MHKIFCLGWNKTGTTSMRYMLKDLGYHIPHWYVGYDLIPDYMNNDYDRIFEVVKHYNAFQDNPWNFPNLYELFDKKYDAKFILTIRSPDSWLNSLKKWVKKAGGIKNLPHGPKFNKYFFDSDCIDGNEDKYLDFYSSHNENIKKYFNNRSNFIIFNFWEGDGWEKLCKFLDKPVPNKKVPHRNKSR